MSEQILIGVIISPHGLKGEVKIKFFTDTPDNLTQHNFFDEEGNHIKFTRITLHKGEIFICKLKGVNDRNESELLCKKQIFIKKQELPKTESDQYYIHDLENMDILDHEGKKIGKISNIMDYGAGPIIEITDTANKKSLVRLTNENFAEINIEKNFAILAK